MNLTISTFSHFLSGAIFLGYAICALVFRRFQRKTGERLFGFFSVAFFLLALERIALLFTGLENTGAAIVFLARLTAFSLIIIAIADKNRRAGPRL